MHTHKFPIADVNDDLFDVMSELTPVAARWRHLGTGLRLKSGDLDTIALKHHGNPQDYLTDVHTRTHTDAIEYDEGMDKEEQLTGGRVFSPGKILPRIVLM